MQVKKGLEWGTDRLTGRQRITKFHCSTLYPSWISITSTSLATAPKANVPCTDPYSLRSAPNPAIKDLVEPGALLSNHANSVLRLRRPSPAFHIVPHDMSPNVHAHVIRPLLKSRSHASFPNKRFLLLHTSLILSPMWSRGYE